MESVKGRIFGIDFDGFFVYRSFRFLSFMVRCEFGVGFIIYEFKFYKY